MVWLEKEAGKLALVQSSAEGAERLPINHNLSMTTAQPCTDLGERNSAGTLTVAPVIQARGVVANCINTGRMLLRAKAIGTYQ